MKELLRLFLAFVKIGAFTFGGGYAMLPMLQKEVVERNGWVTEEELLDVYAVGQCTPGVIAVNTATFVGTKVRGALGGAVATFAVVLPSMLIISVIALFLRNFAENEFVRYAFSGIRVAVAVLVCDSLYKLCKKGLKGAMSIVLFCTALLYGIFPDLVPAAKWLSPVWIILAAVILGLILAWKEHRNE